MRQIVSALTLEWWRASGEHSLTRLALLFEHYADVYALKSEDRKNAWELTQAGVKPGELA